MEDWNPMKHKIKSIKFYLHITYIMPRVLVTIDGVWIAEQIY
jgi:hypothetical protein